MAVNWSDVGTWLKGNAGTGASLVGSLITGNIPGAVAAGVALVSSATGTNNATEALEALQTNPETVIRLRELTIQNDASLREHLRIIHKQELDNLQAEHETTQKTIQGGDVAEDVFVRRTRPAQSWISLSAALVYVFTKDTPSVEILMLLLALPWAYAGLRQIGKGIESFKPSK